MDDGCKVVMAARYPAADARLPSMDASLPVLRAVQPSCGASSPLRQRPFLCVATRSILAERTVGHRGALFGVALALYGLRASCSRRPSGLGWRGRASLLPTAD